MHAVGGGGAESQYYHGVMGMAVLIFRGSPDIHGKTENITVSG